MGPIALIYGLSFTQLAIAIIGFAAIIAIVVIALRVFQITPPAWFMQVLWVLLAAFVCIGAVLLIASMMRGA